MLKQSFERVKILLIKNKDKLLILSKELMKNEILSKDEIKKILTLNLSNE